MITPATDLGAGGPKAKFRNNLSALSLLARLQSEGRSADEDEQAVLARYIGWGGLPQAFDPHNTDWATEYRELRGALDTDSYSKARRSTQDAHYTPHRVVKAIYDGLLRLGFPGGKMCDAGSGTGHFIGAMPPEMRATTAFTAIELDSTTSAIAKQLYPTAKHINAGYEDVFVPDDYFDAVVGNPPFGKQTVHDPNHRELGEFSLHNYFIAKSIMKVRPGGIVAVVVSRYFMDATSPVAREFVSERAHLLAAIRLPNDTFEQNALAKVTTDVVFLQRRVEGDTTNARWLEVEPIEDPRTTQSFKINRYFVDHPEMMLGTMTLVKGAFGDQPELLPPESFRTVLPIDEAIKRLPSNIYTQAISTPAREPSSSIDVPNRSKVGSYFVTTNGAIARRLPDILGVRDAEVVTPRNAKAKDRMTGMIAIRDQLAMLMDAELTDASDDVVEQHRASLNALYDRFVARLGHLSSQANRLSMSDDPEYPLLFALETDYDKGISSDTAAKAGVSAKQPSAGKAAIMSRRVLSPRREVVSVETAKEALLVSLNERGRVDVDHIARLCGRTEEEAIEELGALIFLNPENDNWETADRYLSGNVKHKLEAATIAAEKEPHLEKNVRALRPIQPADIDPVDIAVQLGSTWVPAEDVRDFVRHLFGDVRMSITYQPALGQWSARIEEGDVTTSRAIWGTQRYHANDLVADILTRKTIKVVDNVGTAAAPVYRMNAPETAAANQKADAVRQAFLDWIWSDKARRERLSRVYNDTFNTNVPPRYDGSHLQLPGASLGVRLNQHQKDAIWRGIQEGSTLEDHTVGAGKTFVLIGVLMESRRVGLLKKPMLVVPNHLTIQWKDEFYRLYPNANILVADKTDFAKENRQRLFARIATGDWDAVIVAHSSFKRIGLPPQALKAILEEQIEDLTEAIERTKRESGQRFTIKQMEKTRDKMKSRMVRAADTGAKDDVVTFDQLGIDAIAVDEAQEFKNLQIVTSMSRVSGLGNLAGSEKAFDLFVKSRYLQMKHQGRGVYLATGTPVSNTIAEVYTVNRYLRYDDMKARGISHFDAWASTFGEVVTGWELDATGVNYRLNSRFAKFQNVPELTAMYRSFADVITQVDLQRQAAATGKRFPVPRMKGGKPINVVVDRSPIQARYMGELEPVRDSEGMVMIKADGTPMKDWNRGSIIYRMENLPDDPREDNPLKITNDARKAGLDFRLIDPNAADHPGSKVNVCVENVLTNYREWDDKKGTQLVFCDLSTPKKSRSGATDIPIVSGIEDEVGVEDAGDDDEASFVSMDELLASSGRFSVYEDIKQKLIQAGVPSDHVRFIHDATTDAQKAKLFAEMNRGDVRILLGSTSKMGAGTNVQRRLVALHHLDAPWRPSDLEQRDGRGLRQGNFFYEEDPDGFEIAIYRYATKMTYDSRMWQTIEVKAAGIEQFRRGDMLTRTIEDVAGEAANAAEMKAAATGNPLIFLQVKLASDLKQEEAGYANYVRSRHSLEKRLEWLEGAPDRSEKAIARWQGEISIRDSHAGDDIPFIAPGGRLFTSDHHQSLLEHATDRMREAIDRAVVGNKAPVEVGSYRGFAVLVSSAAGRLNFVVRGSGSFESDRLSYDRNDAFSARGFIVKLENYMNSFERRIHDVRAESLADAEEHAKVKVELTKGYARLHHLTELRADVADVMAELQKMQGDDQYVSRWTPRTGRRGQDDPKPAASHTAPLFTA